MKKIIVYRFIALSVLSLVLLQSCKKKKEEADPYADVTGHYFSIRQFALDEWQTFRGSPFTILKTVREDKKTDSSFTTSDTLNWGVIFKTFFETEISDRKYLGQYTYNQFEDNQEGTRNFYYKANDEDMFTQKLLISADQVNNKVKGIYIETYKKNIWGATLQKLYYAPMKTIQIQTDEKPTVGARKFKVVQYYFMR